MDLTRANRQAQRFRSQYTEIVSKHGQALTPGQAREAVARSCGFSSWEEVPVTDREALTEQTQRLHEWYPKLTEDYGPALTPYQANHVVARLRGFSSWIDATRQAARVQDKAAPGETTRGRQRYSKLSIKPAESMGAAYRFKEVAAERLNLPAGSSASFRNQKLGVLVLEATPEEARDIEYVEERLETELAELGGTGEGPFPSQMLSRRLAAGTAVVSQCGLYLEGWNFVVDTLYAQNRFEDALAVSEPIANALLRLAGVPASRPIPQELPENWVFFRIMHTHVWLLDRFGRNEAADDLAQRMVALDPNDTRFGFSNLTTSAGREARDREKSWSGQTHDVQQKRCRRADASRAQWDVFRKGLGGVRRRW